MKRTASLLPRMQLVRPTPEVYFKPISQREQATLVRARTSSASRIHAELRSLRFRPPRGRLLTGEGRN